MSSAFEQYRGTKRTRLEAIDTLGRDMKTFNGRLGEGLMSSSENLRTAFNDITTQVCYFRSSHMAASDFVS